jgi:hypothetical protein
MFHEPGHISIKRRSLKLYKINQDDDTIDYSDTTDKKKKVKYKILTEEDDFIPEEK